MKSISKYFFLFLLIPAMALGTTPTKKHEKSKEVSKTFQVNKDATLKISNKYGNVDVTTWDKNTIQIDVTITVKGNNLSKVEDRLNDVRIDFNASESMVEARTLFGNTNSGWSWWKRNNKINFQINYRVKMPVTNNANLNNDYGNISLDKLEGQANINCDYGKINVGDLLGTNSNINLDYSKSSSINSMKNGNINTDYSSLSIDKAEHVKVNCDYSNLKLGTLKSVTYNADYGSIGVNDVETVLGNSDYTGIKVGKLRKKLRLSTDYGQVRIGELVKGFESVDIKSEYASIRMGVGAGVAFDFTVDLQYARFNKGNAEIFKNIEKNTKKYYEGKYNGGGTATVNIKSQHGGVSFYEK